MSIFVEVSVRILYQNEQRNSETSYVLYTTERYQYVID